MRADQSRRVARHALDREPAAPAGGREDAAVVEHDYPAVLRQPGQQPRVPHVQGRGVAGDQHYRPTGADRAVAHRDVTHAYMPQRRRLEATPALGRAYSRESQPNDDHDEATAASQPHRLGILVTWRLDCNIQRVLAGAAPDHVRAGKAADDVVLRVS